MQSADLRDDAERALVIASLGNLEVGGKHRTGPRARDLQSGQQMRRAGIGNRPQLGRFGAAQEIGQIEEIAGADKDIDFRELLRNSAP